MDKHDIGKKRNSAAGLVILILMIAVFFFIYREDSEIEIPYSDFKNLLKQDLLEDVVITSSTIKSDVKPADC